MTASPDPRLAALRALAEKATPGPWQMGGPYPSTSVIVQTDPGSSGEDPTPPEYEAVAILDTRTEGEPNQQARADAAFIAAANPQAILAILDALAAAEGERDMLRTALVETVNVLGNGSFASPESSAEFLRHAPQEVAGVIAALRKERDDFHAAYRLDCDRISKAALIERDALAARLAGAREALQKIARMPEGPRAGCLPQYVIRDIAVRAFEGSAPSEAGGEGRGT